MGIPIGGGRRRGRRRRSYADYKPPSRNQGPKDDPFRVVFYLILIGAALWVYFNQETVKAEFLDRIGEVSFGERAEEGSGATAPNGATPLPTFQPEDYAAQGEQAYREGNLVGAIGFYREAASLEPNTIEYHVEVARLLLFQSAMEYGDQRMASLEEALQAANGAILADPERPEGYAIMGKVLDWSGEYDRALSEISRALEIDQTYAEGHSYLAETMIDLDRWDQAQQEAQEALALAPDNVDVRRDYAYVLENLADYAGAATQYEAALRLHPKLPYLHMALGRIYREVGRYQEAIDQFFNVETIDPTNVLIPFEIGRTYESYVGDPNAALQYYERAVDADPYYPFPWARIGTIRYLQGSYVQAIPAFERALALDVDDVNIYYQLGLSYAYEENCEEAIPKLLEAEQRSQGDEAILDVVQAGFEMCPEQAPRLTPTPTIESTP